MRALDANVSKGDAREMAGGYTSNLEVALHSHVLPKIYYEPLKI